MLRLRFTAVSQSNHLKLGKFFVDGRLKAGQRLGLSMVHTGRMLTYVIRKGKCQENTTAKNHQKQRKIIKLTLINQNKMSHRDSDQKYSLKCGVNSFIATYIAGVLHPLDVAKTRFQSHDGKGQAENLVPKYNGVLNALTTIYHQEGFRGLYKGFQVSMLTQAAVTAMFFCMYELGKRKHMDSGTEEMLAVTLASTQASIISTLITQPLWVIKTRMILNTKPNLRDIHNFLFSVKQISRQEGLRGFATGLNISLILSFSGVLQMFTYEGSKKMYDSMNIPQSMLSEKHFLCGALSKFVAVIITYPLTTVRTRAQQNQYIKDDKTRKYRGSIEIIKQTFKGQGIHGFYKGFHINIVRGILQRGIYFYWYELLKTMTYTNMKHGNKIEENC